MSDFFGFKSLGRGLYKHTKRTFEPTKFAINVARDAINANKQQNAGKREVSLDKAKKNCFVSIITFSFAMFIMFVFTTINLSGGKQYYISAFACFVFFLYFSFFAIRALNDYFEIEEQIETKSKSKALDS